MTEEVIEQQVAAPETDIAAQPSDTAPETEVVEKASSTDTEETVTSGAETDEQKNKRVQQEEQERAAKRSRGVQKRMDELTRDKYAERQRAENLEKQNAELLALVKGGRTQTAVQPTDGRPNPTAYVHGESDAQYIRDDAVWLAEQRARAIIEENSKTQTEAQQRQATEQSERAANVAYMTRQRAIAKTIPDFDAVMAEGADTISVPNDVFSMIKRMPDGPLVAYHMVKNPQLAEQFANADPDDYGIVMGQMLATLKGSAKVSNAPPPGKTVKATTGSSSEPPLDTEAYFEWRRKNMR